MNSKVPDKNNNMAQNLSLEKIQERSQEITQKQIEKEKPRKRVEKMPSSTETAPQLSVEQLMIVKNINTVNLDQLKELLKPKADGSSIDLNFTINSEGLTPLMFACSKQDANLVKLLLAESPTLNLNLGNKNGQTPLHLAANYKSLELSKLFTDKALKPEQRATLTKTQTNGTSPLHIAVKNNDMPLVRYFVEEMKADVNDSRERDESDDVLSGGLPTRNSASNGNMLESVKAVTCLQMAVTKSQWEMASYLLSQGAYSTPEMVYESCKNGGDIKVVKTMLKKLEKKLGEADFQTKVVNGRFNKFKQTPLMKICFAGKTDLLNYVLVKLKADTTIIDVKDETCLFSAVKGNHPEIISQLVQHNSQISFVDYECQRNGQTAFSRAVLSGLFNIADILNSQGHANFEYVNKKDGVSILDMAKSLKNTDAVKYLQKLKLQSLKQEIHVKQQQIEDKKEDKQLTQQPEVKKENNPGKNLHLKEEEKVSPQTNLNLLTPVSPQLNREPSFVSSNEPYTPIEAPSLIFVVEIAKTKPFYKRNDFFLEKNDSCFYLTLTPKYFDQISHSCEMNQIHDDELKLIRKPAIFEFITHSTDLVTEQKEKEDQKDENNLDIKTQQLQNVKSVKEKITMQIEDNSEWEQVSVLNTKQKAVFDRIQMNVEQITEKNLPDEEQKHQETPKPKIDNLPKIIPLFEIIKISKEQFNEHQEILEEEKVRIEDLNTAQHQPNNMLSVIPEEQYSPNSVSPSPQQQPTANLIKPELIRQSTAHLDRQSLENLPLRQVSEPKRLQSNKQESSNGNTEQEFNQYHSELVDIDHLIKSKDLQNADQSRDERDPTSNLHLNESESEPFIRPPRRQLSNQTNENGAIYSVPSSQEASSQEKQSLQKSPTKWSVDNSSRQEENNRPASSSSSFDRSNDQGDNVVITQQRSSLVDSSEESSGFDRASKQNTSTIDKKTMQDMKLQKQVIENLQAFEQRLTVLEKEGELHLTTNSDDESVQKEMEQHRKIQVLRDTISEISKQQSSVTSSPQSSSINRTSSLAPSSMVGKQMLVNMQKHTLMNLEKFDNRLRKLEKGMKESVSSSSDYSSDSSDESSLSRSHSIISHSQQSQVPPTPTVSKDINNLLQPPLQQKKSLTIPKATDQPQKSATLVQETKKIETIKLNKDNIKLQPQVTQKQATQQKSIAKSPSVTKSRQSSNDSNKNNSSPFRSNLVKTEKKSDVSKSPPKQKVKILDTTPASDPIDVNNLTKKQQQAIPISTLMKLKRLEKMNKFKPQLDASALKKSTQSQKSKKSFRKSQDYSDDNYDEDSPDDISRSTLKKDEENERTRNQFKKEINLNNTQLTLEEQMRQNLLQSRSNIEISSLQDSMTAGTQNTGIALGYPDGIIQQITGVSQNTGIAHGYPEGILQHTQPIKIQDEDDEILKDQQKNSGDKLTEKEQLQKARIIELNKINDKLNSMEIKGMAEFVSDISKFIEGSKQAIELIILDKNGNPEKVKITVHQGVPGYFDKNGTFISLTNAQLIELAQGHKELENALKSVINKNPGELASIISKLSEIKQEIKQYQEEKQRDKGDINLRDSKGVLIINKNKIVGQARTTQDQSPTNVDIRMSKELFGRQQSGAQLRKSLVRTSGQFRSQMKQNENNRDKAGTELGNYRNFLGGNLTSLDAYSTDAMTNFNHDQALKSASKLLKITSPDYYKAKLIKLRNKTPATLQALESKPLNSVSVLDQLDQKNVLTKASIRQSLQFVSKLANIEIVKVKPPTLLMNQRFASPQVNIQDQLLSKHHVEEPESMKDAAANIQLSLLKLKQIKEQYRGRYKYSRFSLGQ